MSIDGVIPRGRPVAMGGAEVQPALLAPVVHTPYEEPSPAPDTRPRRSGRSCGSLVALRHQALQNPPVARANTTPPGPHSTDSQLAGEMEKNYGELHPFLEKGGLRQLSLHDIAAKEVKGEVMCETA